MALLLQLALNLQQRSPVYAVRINVDWRLGSTFSLSPGLLLPPFNQLYWPLTPAAPPIQQSITASYNKNLIGKDQLPSGEQISDLVPRGYPEPATRTWAVTYNPNLVGKDRLPSGEQLFDRPSLGPAQTLREWTQNLLETTLGVPPVVINYMPRAPLYAARVRVEWYQNWSLNLLQTTLAPTAPAGIPLPLGLPRDWPVPRGPQPLTPSLTVSYNLNLIGQDQLPTGAISVSLAPRGYEYRIQAHSWTWNYNLNLIGKDQLPIGDISTALTTKPYEYHVQLRSWSWMYNLNLIGKDQVPGEQITDLPPRGPQQPIPILAASYNPNLIGKDQLPIGEVTTALPTQPTYPVSLRSWNWTSTFYYLSIPGPWQVVFSQYSWPLTPAPKPIEQTVTASYNLNLIGQDFLPFRQQDWPNPTPPYRQPQLSTWIDQVKLLLQTPFKQTDWPVPSGPRQPIQIHTSSYNLNLIGQDQLPVGEVTTALPPQPALSAIQLRTWIQTVNLELFVAPQFPRPPFNQFDWPINPGPQQPTLLFYAAFNKNLIGKDKLPTGKNVYDLPPRGPAPLFQTWSQGFSPFRKAPPLPLNQYDWPVPRGAWDGRDRTFSFTSQFIPQPPPTPQFPNVEAPLIRDFWDSDEWGNIIKGYCVRGT